jgi:hypothetical protein
MNSGISTSEASGFRPWHFFVLASLIAATAAVLMAQRPTPEHLVLISATLAAAGLVGAAFHRTLLPLVSSTSELTSEPLGHRTRAALEREKTLTLRAIKELEFDFAMGKVAEADFRDMAGRLRARAIGIMRQLEEGTSYRDLIERELEKKKMGSDPIFPVSRCACGTQNDADARFCKACGAKLAGAA